MVRSVGWGLALVGFASSIALDPWALEHDALTAFPFRQAQIAVLTMAFFLLSLARAGNRRGTIPAEAVRLTTAGAILYAVGWITSAWFALPTPIAVAGLVGAAIGCALWAARVSDEGRTRITKAALWTMAGGCVLLTITSLWTLLPQLRPAYIGSDDGLRLRLLRLAQVAAFALPSLVLLLPEDDTKANEKWHKVMARGAWGMPAVLSVAAFSSTAFKYLLPLPALAVFGASSWAAWQTKQGGRSLAFAGWLVIAGSMGIGLFMGLYAFSGPVPAPPHFENYNDFVRRLSRLGHAYLILIGLLSLFIAGERNQTKNVTNKTLLWLLGSGMLITVGTSVCAAARLLPPGVLCLGPVLVTTALVLHLVRSDTERKRL